MKQDEQLSIKVQQNLDETQTYVQDEASIGSSIGSTSALAHRPEVVILCWPLRSQWKRTWAMLAAYLAGGGIVFQLSTDLLVSALITLALIIVSWRMWVPMRYRVGSSGIICSVWGYQRQLSWAWIRRIRRDDRGVQVFYDREPSLTRFRQSFYILAEGEQLDSLLGAFHYYLAGSLRKEQ